MIELVGQHTVTKEEQRKTLVWTDATPVDYMHQGRSDGGGATADENYFGLTNTGHFNDMSDPINNRSNFPSGPHRDWYQMQYGIVEVPLCD